ARRAPCPRAWLKNPAWIDAGVADPRGRSAPVAAAIQSASQAVFARAEPGSCPDDLHLGRQSGQNGVVARVTFWHRAGEHDGLETRLGQMPRELEHPGAPAHIERRKLVIDHQNAAFRHGSSGLTFDRALPWTSARESVSSV